jgi:hypothetical protein
MTAFSIGDIVYAELSTGTLVIGEIYRIDDDEEHMLEPFYFINFPGHRSKVISIIPYKESKLTFIATKEQYLLTNPEFFL